MAAGRAGSRRLFFALWPDSTVRPHLNAAKAKCNFVKANWTADRNLHMTLVFLGSVDNPRYLDLVDAVCGVCGEPFDLYLLQIDYRARKKMLWLKPDPVPRALLNLVVNLGIQLEPLGFKSGRRHFLPHVTLARNATGASAVTPIAPVFWPVTTFALVESVLADGAVYYKPLKTWKLCGLHDTRR